MYYMCAYIYIICLQCTYVKLKKHVCSDACVLACRNQPSSSTWHPPVPLAGLHRRHPPGHPAHQAPSFTGSQAFFAQVSANGSADDHDTH